MNIIETDIVAMLNENERINNTGYVVLEVKIPNEVGVLDKAKYKALFHDCNLIITGQGGKKQPEYIVGKILDILKVALKIATKVPTGSIKKQFIPKELLMHFKISNPILGGKPFVIRLNPVGYIIDILVDNMVSKLFEIAVSPIRVKYMVKSYEEMISNLEQIKRTCKDKEISNKCDMQIDRINRAIKELESRIIKEDSTMKTIRETMNEIDENERNLVYTEAEAYDLLTEMEAECLEEGELPVDNFFDEGCKGKSKNEGVDEEEDEDDVEDMDESYLFDIDDDLFGF